MMSLMLERPLRAVAKSKLSWWVSEVLAMYHLVSAREVTLTVAASVA